MQDRAKLSETKRALLEKYLRGDFPPQIAEVRHIPRYTGDGPIPLSSAQVQIWLQSQLTPHRPVYHQGVHISLPGPLDVPTLEKSLYEIIRRHAAWRTSFPVVDEQPVQRIHPSFELPLLKMDLSHRSEERRV